MSRWMCLDVGSKKIGVAVTDPLKITARPLTTLRRQNLSQDVGQLCKIIAEHQIEKLVVGKPLHLSGRESSTLKIIEPLISQLREMIKIEVEWAEERLSTKEAEQIMAKKNLSIKERRLRRDEFSAAVILQWYLSEIK